VDGGGERPNVVDALRVLVLLMPCVEDRKGSKKMQSSGFLMLWRSVSSFGKRRENDEGVFYEEVHNFSSYQSR
jgi:hypothetical protein